jgi:mRNA degradation ribonuclease J1/J2
MRESEELMAEVKAAIREALAARGGPGMIDAQLVGATVRSAVRRFITQRFQRKPIVIPVVLEV